MGISFKKLLLIPVLGLGLSVLASDHADAAPSGSTAIGGTGSLGVSADVRPSCSLSTTGMTFPAYDGLADVAGTGGQLTLTCTNGAHIWIGLGAGSNYDSTASKRRLTSNNGDTAYYHLYWPGTTTEWGDLTSGGYYDFGVDDGASSNVTVDGLVEQNLVGGVPTKVKSGVYNDSVTVSLYY